MHYILEACIVGLYTCLIYSLILPLQVSNKYFVFFIAGFTKHFCSYYLELHTYYCNNGYACKNTATNTKKISNITLGELFIQSILEGFLFIMVGILLFWYVPVLRNNKLLLFFMIGFLLHIIFEILGLHKIFCKRQCK